MDDVAVDVEQAGAVRLLVDQVVGPDFVVEGARLWHVVTCHSFVVCSVLDGPWREEKGAGPRNMNKKKAGQRRPFWTHWTWPSGCYLDSASASTSVSWPP